MDRWSQLSMKDKSDLMSLYIRNGIDSLEEIKKRYNSFATGGQMNTNGSEEDEKKDNPPATHVTFGTYDEYGNIIPKYYLNQVNIGATQPYRTPEQEAQVTRERNMYFDAMRHFNNGNQDTEGLKETYVKYPELRSYLKRIGMSENDFMSAATGRDYETNSYERERTRQFNKDIQKAETDRANTFMQAVQHQNPNDQKLAAIMTGILGGVTGTGILGGLTSVGQGINTLNTAKTVGKTALNFMGRPVSTLASAQGWTNILPAATAFDQSLMGTLGLAGVYDATSRGIKGEIPWYDAIGEGALSGLMTMDLYPALKGGAELVNDAYNQARLLREFSRTIPENEVSNVAQAYKQKIWRNFLNSRNGDNYYRKEIIKSKNNYTPDENYFVSHTTPWQEHIGKENLYGLDAYPKEDLGQVLYELPTETFGAKLSTDFQGFPTEYSVIDMGKNHLLYGERASGPRDFVKMFDKKMPWGKKSKEQFEIGLTERPLKDGVYDKNPIYEDIYLGNQTTVSGEALKKAMSETTYNEFLNTPYGIQKTLHLGKPTITQYPTLDQAIQEAKVPKSLYPKVREMSPMPDYESPDANGLGVMFPIQTESGEIIGTIPIDAQMRWDKNGKQIFTWWGGEKGKYIDISSVGGSVEIDEAFRGKGYGKSAYLKLAEWAERQGKSLRSAPDHSRTEDATRVWKALERDGFAHKEGSRYIIDNKTLDKSTKDRIITPKSQYTLSANDLTIDDRRFVRNVAGYSGYDVKDAVTQLRSRFGDKIFDEYTAEKLTKLPENVARKWLNNILADFGEGLDVANARTNHLDVQQVKKQFQNLVFGNAEILPEFQNNIKITSIPSEAKQVINNQVFPRMVLDKDRSFLLGSDSFVESFADDFQNGLKGKHYIVDENVWRSDPNRYQNGAVARGEHVPGKHRILLPEQHKLENVVHEDIHEMEEFIGRTDSEKKLLQNYGSVEYNEQRTSNSDARMKVLQKMGVSQQTSLEEQNKAIDSISDDDLIEVLKTTNKYVRDAIKDRSINKSSLPGIRNAMKYVGVAALPIIGVGASNSKSN